MDLWLWLATRGGLPAVLLLGAWLTLFVLITGGGSYLYGRLRGGGNEFDTERAANNAFALFMLCLIFGPAVYLTVTHFVQ